VSATIPRRTLIAAAVVLAAVALAYSNHFENSFQFDDAHVIVDNPFIRSVDNLPRFFTDPVTQSTEPTGRNWRPLVLTTLAIDYAMGGGLKSTFYFHLSTFLLYLLQLILMYLLFSAILDRARPDPRNFWIAWFAVALYGLHPVMADTVNYIVQRAEALSAVGLVAGLVVYIRFPEERSRGYYLALFAAATLAKAPALVFPLLLLAYILLFEESVSGNRFTASLKKSAPAFAAGVAMALLQRAMTPPTFHATDRTFLEYAPFQPFVMLRYLRAFILPTNLSVESDLGTSWLPARADVLAGFLALAALIAAIWYTARHARLRPIAFGLVWFLVTLAPTALFPLGEMENDHRMFLPFIGLILAVVWTGALLLLRETFWRKGRVPVMAALACLLAASAYGVHERNTVWRDHESLWRNVVETRPGSGRGYTNYGLALTERGGFAEALPFLEHGVRLRPNNALGHAALAIDLGQLGRQAEAESHFQRAIKLGPQDSDFYFYYARWLNQRARTAEAVAVLLASLKVNPPHLLSRRLLMEIYSQHGVWKELKEVARETLALHPGDPVAPEFLKMEEVVQAGVMGAEKNARVHPTPENYLQLSTQYHQAGRYNECIAAAQQSLRLKPDSAEAYNNMAAAYASMRQWDNAIAAAQDALRYKPDFEFARRNLEYASAQKAAAGGN
jgi:tetratricopeptide (TPR) repeat protein